MCSERNEVRAAFGSFNKPNALIIDSWTVPFSAALKKADANVQKPSMQKNIFFMCIFSKKTVFFWNFYKKEKKLLDNEG